jgi:hypothetical protein
MNSAIVRSLTVSASDDFGLQLELSIDEILVLLKHFVPSLACMRQRGSHANPDRISFQISSLESDPVSTEREPVL